MMDSVKDSTMDLKERILATAAAAPSLSRTATRLRLVLLVAGGTAVMAAVYWLFALRIFGWQSIPRSRVLPGGTLMGAAAVAAIAMVTAVGRGRHMLGRSRRWLIAVTVLAPVALLAWKIGWSAIFGNLVESPRLGYRCLLMSMAMGGVPLASLVMTRKGDDPRHPSLLGAAMGVAVGACGWVLIDLWCPVAGPIHLLRGHVLPVVLLGLLGAAVGKVALAVHAKH
jgi:hypothetical protein